MSFTSDLQSFAQKTGIRMDTVVRKVAIDLTRDLVKATPVDTGLARSSYFFGSERDASLELPANANKKGRPSIERMTAFQEKLKAGGTFYITNNQVYILQIMEYGTSKQMAPGGVTRIVGRWQQIVDGAARGARADRVDFFKTGVEE